MNNVPENLKPLSAWAYFGYNILFNIPVIGLIFLIIFSLNNNNINRRNYARSFFCIYLILIILIIILIASGFSFSAIINMIEK